MLVICTLLAIIPRTNAKKCIPYECLPLCTKSQCDSQESTGGHGTGSGGDTTGAGGMGTDMGGMASMSTKFARLLFMPMMPNHPAMMPNPSMFYNDHAAAAGAATTPKYLGAQQWKQPYYYFMMNPRNNIIRYKRSAKVDKIELAQMAAKKVLEKLEEKKKKKESKPSAKKLIKALLQTG